MKARSLLFVPGDRPDRFQKAASSSAEGLILDLEDSVAAERKSYARSAVAEFLGAPLGKPVIVRVNGLDTPNILDDLKLFETISATGVMLPKAEGAESIRKLLSIASASLPPILPVATETPKAIFQLGSYQDVSEALLGLTWGAEDLPAAIGATTSRDNSGHLTSPYELVRSLSLFAAHAANVLAIETIYPNIKDASGLREYALRARRDGFTGMMAIHPVQTDIINQAFAYSVDEIERAKKIVAAFNNTQSAQGAVQLDGKMLDAPHLKQARRILASIDAQ